MIHLICVDFSELHLYILVWQAFLAITTNIYILHILIYLDYGHIDLGAEWIHGQQGNPLYDLAASHKLILRQRQSLYISHSSASLLDEQEFRTENGNIVNRDTVTKVSNVMEDLYELSLAEASTKKIGVELLPEAMKKKNMTKSNEVKSFASHFAEGFDQYLKRCDDDETNARIKRALYRWRLKWELTDNCCESLDDVAFPGRYSVYEGHGEVDLKAGFQTVIDVLRLDIPEKNIRLSKPVKLIKWNQRISSVECYDGSLFNARYVIVTVPIGYLKENMTSMFSPPLPERKSISIRNFGFATTVKLFFIWQTPFWNDLFSGVQFVWLNNTVSGEVRKEIEENQTTTMLKV